MTDSHPRPILPDGFSRLTQPLIIGNRRIENRLLLSPMAGLTHIAFRTLVSELGGHGLLFTEMCNARAVPSENRNISMVFKWRDAELPYLVCQLYGDSPEPIARAAARVEAEGFFGVDINMGCSAAAICRQNSGAALLKNPKQAARIVTEVRKAVSIPIFVKFRTGWRDDPLEAARFARMFEAAGADALVFHPRVAPDRRSRPPKWEYIRIVKDTVRIPVFGNGNVIDVEDAAAMLSATGCDGIALGRIAVAKPWIFREWTCGVAPDENIFAATATAFIDLLEKYFDPIQAIKRFKKFCPYFAANFKFGHDLLRRLGRCGTLEELRIELKELFQIVPERGTRPNMNMFIV